MAAVRTGDLTAAEQGLTAAFPAGAWADAGGAEVSGHVVAGLLTAPPGRRDATVPAVRLRDAVVTGLLDLSYAEVAAPLLAKLMLALRDPAPGKTARGEA